MAKLDPKTFGNFYRVLTGVVVPRPIAFVSTVSPDGVNNLAPYSFFNAVASSPPTIVFSSSRRAGSKSKDTLDNVEATGEFVVNIVSDDIAEAMNRTAAEFPAEVSEFDVAGLTPAASDIVRAPRVAESPVNMECRLQQVVNLDLGEGDHTARPGYRGGGPASHPGRHHRRPPGQPPPCSSPPDALPGACTVTPPTSSRWSARSTSPTRRRQGRGNNGRVRRGLRRERLPAPGPGWSEDRRLQLADCRPYLHPLPGFHGRRGHSH